MDPKHSVIKGLPCIYFINIFYIFFFFYKKLKPEDHWSCIAHLSAEDMLNWKYMSTLIVLYMLSPIQKHHETNSTLSQKWQWSTQGHHLKKAPGHGHTTTWCKFWHNFKAFIIPIILYQFQKDPCCFIILYDILFYFIHVHIYIAPG